MGTFIKKAVETFLINSEADQDGILGALAQDGFTPREAWRINQFVPIAFVHVVLRDRGVKFEPGYLLMNSETNVRTQHSFADEPLYVAAVRVAEEWVDSGCTFGQLLPVFGRSAEWDAIRKLAKNGDISGICLTEPILMEFVD